jgi:hypothetical protein
MSDFEEWHKKFEEQRKKKLQDILKLAKKHRPISYVKFVHLLFLELDLPYNQNQKRGVYNKELDSLIAVGKILLGHKQDGSSVPIICGVKE